MKWITADIDLYLQSKEYVDTAIIPLVPISFDQQMKNTVLNGEFITSLSSEIERQFKGRMFLIPPFTYLKEEDKRPDVERLLSWKQALMSKGFNHIIFMTSDSDWKQYEETIGNTLIWSPAVPLEHAETKMKQQIMTDQVSQLVPSILSAWRN